jgi:hypothetical protein
MIYCKKNKLIYLLLLALALSVFTGTRIPEVNAPVLVTVNKVVYSSNYDATIYNGGTNYLVAHENLTGYLWSPSISHIGGQRNSTGWYNIFRNILWFDLTFMPSDANISSAILSLYISQDHSATDFNVTMQRSSVADLPHVPVVSNDYRCLYYYGDLGSKNTSALAGLGFWNITMNSAGKNYIKSYTSSYQYPYTPLILRSKRDINSIAPSGDEYLLMCAADMGYTVAPKLYLTYTTSEVQYNVYGVYDESGIRSGATNCSVYRENLQPLHFVINGTHNFTAMNPISLTYQIGFNQSRTYYLLPEHEDIFIFRPSDPYYTYFFEVVDYIGLEWGYLESRLNVNGTDRVVERWKFDRTTSDLPFTMSFGVTYTMRLICEKGTFVFGTWTAGAATTKTYFISPDMFPLAPTDINGIAVNATRKNSTWIQAYYNDIYLNTTWVNFEIYEWGVTTPIYTYNTTSQTVTLNWLEGGSDTDYYVTVTILHRILGTRQWSFPCSTSVSNSNPFDILRTLGTFPFDANQIPAVLILIIVGLGCFTWLPLPLGLVVQVITAAILVWLNWLAISWAWLTMAGCFVFLIALSEAKQREIG